MKFNPSIALLSLATVALAAQQPLAEDPSATGVNTHDDTSHQPSEPEASDSLKQRLGINAIQQLAQSFFNTESEPTTESTTESTSEKKCVDSDDFAHHIGKALADSQNEKLRDELDKLDGKRKQGQAGVEYIKLNLEDFEEKQCGGFERIYGEWRYSFKSNMADSECDYTSLSQTVGRAVGEFVDKKHFKNCKRDCDTMCLRFDQGGPWDGYVRLGKKDKFDRFAYCGPTLSLVPNRL
ncbi:hypothetical protein BO70DRAFT_28877 [Aspergillus heteromorphus CBS 117.55]|uniref:Secreted protein CSS2 C-terminal domain-containing protein n=1 Tax=Aspergillus heteromorphus CBS 117.55 TaxID=1448321 RepID=A0A317WAP6_9EURO|nr:uncharacterized protein BO70DRAFT_28877 [Aspergillus heteromorphus CBS 117.55]PWY83596.1 hypothetical protein BO70DRAFT_28877 [Aspergillus heteromorphus CBS 117.55]